MDTSAAEWQRIKTEHAFKDAFADKTFAGEGVVFTLHADGRISGAVGPARLEGHWTWQGEWFCRTATLDGEDLGEDCENVEMRPGEMRYTRNRGAGDSFVVKIQGDAD